MQYVPYVMHAKSEVANCRSCGASPERDEMARDGGAECSLCYHYAMLNIQNMSYLQGGIPLFQQANLQAFANQRIGLVGKNGCGKSTLFRLIRGEIKPDSGEISLQTG